MDQPRDRDGAPVPRRAGDRVVSRRRGGGRGRAGGAPGTGAAWAGLVERVAPHRELLWRTALSRFPPVGPPLRLAAQLRADALRLGVWGAGPAARMGRRLFGDDRATAWLCGSVSHADLGPGSFASGALAFGLTLLSQLVGGPFPRGGAGRITEALVHHLHELGGEVRCDASVEEIEVRGRRATGVRLAGGERFEADAVVVTAGPPRLEAMLPA